MLVLGTGIKVRVRVRVRASVRVSVRISVRDSVWVRGRGRIVLVLGKVIGLWLVLML